MPKYNIYAKESDNIETEEIECESESCDESVVVAGVKFRFQAIQSLKENRNWKIIENPLDKKILCPFCEPN